jgi:hypothetical protein
MTNYNLDTKLKILKTFPKWSKTKINNKNIRTKIKKKRTDMHIY